MESTIAELKRELEKTHKVYEIRCQELEEKGKQSKTQLIEKTKEAEFLLEDSNKKIKELEEASKSKIRKWENKENTVRNFVNCQLRSMQV